MDLPDLSELFRELTPDPAHSGPTHERLASLRGGPSGHGVGANRQRTIGGQASLDSHQGSISQPSVPSLPGILSPFHMSVSSPAPSAIEPLSPISTGSQEALNLRIPTGPLNSHQAIGGSQRTVSPPAQHGGAGQSHFNSRGGRGGRRCRGRRRFRPYGNVSADCFSVIALMILEHSDHNHNLITRLTYFL